MAQSSKTIKTRVQLKSDTEANWRKAVLTTDHADGEKESGTSFVPLLGEIIVYSPDDSHHFSRLKVGDGESNVLALPFIDSGTLNGQVIPPQEYEIHTYVNYDAFPLIGVANNIYIDVSTYKIYCYYNGRYRLLSDCTYTAETTQVSVINSFNAGMYTRAVAEAGVVTIRHGSQPTLSAVKTPVVKSITKAGET